MKTIREKNVYTFITDGGKEVVFNTETNEVIGVSGKTVKSIPAAVMFGKSNAHKAVMAHLRSLGHRVTLATIRRSVIAESYTAAALPLPVYSPRCGVAKDYEALACEVMAWNDESEVKA